MNFWADVAFTPSSSGNNVVKASFGAMTTGGFGMSALTAGQSATHLPTPAPIGAGTRVTSPVVLGSLAFRRPIPQFATVTGIVKAKWDADEL